MVNQQPFGRRVNTRDRSPRRNETREAAPPQKTVRRDVAVEHPTPPKRTASPLHDDDSPKRSFNLPWRQLSLMATLCFGIASFVLPDSVNDWVQWLLYALTAASLYATFRGRRRDNRRTE